MNKTCRLIWNHLTPTWQAVSEAARGPGRSGAAALLTAADTGFLGASIGCGVDIKLHKEALTELARKKQLSREFQMADDNRIVVCEVALDGLAEAPSPSGH